MHLIDLSHEITHGMVTYPGLPAPKIGDYLSRADSRERYRGEAEFQIAKIEMVGNTGTYADAPSHRHEGQTDVGQLPLASVAFLRGVLVTMTYERRALEVDRLEGLDVRGAAVIVHTGWSRLWGTEAYGRGDHPFVSREAARYLAGAGAALVGIDSVNIDDMADVSRPAHTSLLGAGIVVVEHLTNLEAIGDRPFTFFAVPPPVRGMGTFSVRAFAAV